MDQFHGKGFDIAGQSEVAWTIVGLVCMSPAKGVNGDHHEIVVEKNGCVQ